MPPKTLRLLLPCLGLALLLAVPPAGAVELFRRASVPAGDSRDGRGGVGREAAAAPAGPAVALLVAVWTYLSDAGLLPPPGPRPSAPPPDDSTPFTDGDQGGTLDPNGVV
jgi:hypothetical protein